MIHWRPTQEQGPPATVFAYRVFDHATHCKAIVDNDARNALDLEPDTAHRDA
jgi:hypothetical protein